ncbi:MAG: SDR family oxidoreductase [Candidatus Nitrosocosmicus sp.]|nr:SDR family oxidoreductase [Candidatus Nitrosocosmicus sp.]
MVDTILVTGATGTVGSEVVRQLSKVKNGIVRAAIHSPNKIDTLKQIDNHRIEFVNLDYLESKTVHEALANVQKIFLVTTPSPNSVDITSNLVKEAKKNGIKYIVKLSVMNADAQPGYAMGKLHRLEEKIIEESNIPHTFLRPTSFMQNFVNYFGQTIRNQNAFYFHGGDVKIGFVDARDIATVAVKILTLDEDQYTYNHKSFNVTGQEMLSYNQAAEILSKEIGRKISYVDITGDDLRKGMKQSGMSDWLIDVIMDSLNYIIRGEYGSQTSDVIEQITGRKPISFDQFVRDYSRYFR